MITVLVPTHNQPRR